MDLRELHAALVDMLRAWVRTGAQVELKPYGMIVRDLRHPLVHDANLAWVERAPEGGVEGLMGDLDAAFLGTDVVHRFAIFADAQIAYEHQDAFAAAGFRPDADLVMAKVGLPSCIVNRDVIVREVGIEAPEDHYRLLRAAIHEESGYGSEESRQVYEVEQDRGAALGERAFVGYMHDEPVATYTVWPRETFALIGNVATLPACRMRGVGRTMIFDACRSAVNAGCEYALLTTDLLDTPQTMYKTLGFEPVGELRGFLRRPT